MTADTPAVLYVSIDRSGLSPVPVASFHKHMGADVWVRMPDWQPIETAPKDETTVLLIDARVGGGHPVAAAWVEDDGMAMWKDSEGMTGFFDGFFTHWMPIPELPALAALPAPDEGAQEEGE